MEHQQIMSCIWFVLTFVGLLLGLRLGLYYMLRGLRLWAYHQRINKKD